MVLKIALFNHKGGVSKTTTTFNLGWMLASKGKRVVLVDTDPQCNLTGMVLGFSHKQELEEIYSKKQDIKSALAPAFESQPRLVEAVNCIPIEQQDGLFLLPGHVGLAEYEVTLGIAQELSGSIQTLQNLSGSISYLLKKTAERFSADYILIDMNPSLSSINQNLLMTSDFFIVPTVPDFFSILAIDSLARIIPRWHSWAKKASELKVLKEATYPFPKVTPLFLGTIIQNYRIRNKQPSASFQEWIDRIQKAVSDELVPSLREQNMLLPDEVYSSQDMNDYCLTKMSDFNSLIAISQNCKTPVFALTKEQISQQGKVLKDTLQASSNFRDSFSTLADRIINLTSNAEGKAFINRLGEITAADAEEAQRAAELQAEAERKAAKEAQRAAELQVEKERKVAEEAKRAAQLRAEEERKVAEEAKRVAELREKFDGNPNKGEIFLKIRKIVSEELEIDEEAITLDTNISQDINAESMEIMEIIMAAEEEFDIEIPDEDAENLMRVRVGDIVNYLHDSLKLKAEQKAAEEAQRAAELRAEAERKAEEEAKRAVELQAEAERRAAEEAKRVAELREKFDGNPNKEEIFLRLRKVISEQVSKEYVQLNSHIVNDLGVDELDIISLAMAVEEEFDIEIPSELLDSVEKWPPSHTWSGCFRDKVPVGCTVEELLDYIYQNINDNSETE